jgi:bacterioferritin-associated ferredoxin
VIVCSCNVLSDGQVRSAIATAVSSARMSHVYASLGCVAKCGRCAYTIKNLTRGYLRAVGERVCELDLPGGSRRSNTAMKDERTVSKTW